MIEIKNLTVVYEKTYNNPQVMAIDNLSLNMETRKFNVIVGVSGSGKTTLLRTIAGLQPFKGEISVDGVNFAKLHPSDRNLAYVTQNYALYPHLTVFDNIAFPLKNKGADRKEIIEVVNEVSESLGIKFLLQRKIKELSGGQQQRVALARAIVKKPSLYLFDEPLSNVSGEYHSEEREVIRKAVAQYHSTAIYVTHNLKEATSLADYIYVMKDGKIVYKGTPDETVNSFDPAVRELFEVID